MGSLEEAVSFYCSYSRLTPAANTNVALSGSANEIAIRKIRPPCNVRETQKPLTLESGGPSYRGFFCCASCSAVQGGTMPFMRA